jgi:hypothetical protein
MAGGEAGAQEGEGPGAVREKQGAARLAYAADPERRAKKAARMKALSRRRLRRITSQASGVELRPDRGRAIEQPLQFVG